MALAEEYRKSRPLAETRSRRCSKGLLAHPNYLSAQVALGRAYLESGQITEAIATFSKVLVADPGNLVAAKSLADIYLSRGDTVEAIKKYKLYRAIPATSNVEGVIARAGDRTSSRRPRAPRGARRGRRLRRRRRSRTPTSPARRPEFTTAPMRGGFRVRGPFDIVAGVLRAG